MRRELVRYLAGSAVAAAAIVACVGDDPETVKPATPGELGGDCLSGSLCNTGLVCGQLDGAPKCVPVDGGGNGSSSSSSSSGAVDAGFDAPICRFEPKAFDCKELPPLAPGSAPRPGAACYGPIDTGGPNDASSDAGDAGTVPDHCVLRDEVCTGQGEVKWACHAKKHCGTACCLKAQAFPVAACMKGSLLASPNEGSVCSSDDTCSEGSVKLCQSNLDCVSPQHCDGFAIQNAQPMVNGAIVGVCTD